MPTYIVDRVTVTRERFEIEADSPGDASIRIGLANRCANTSEVDVQVTETGHARNKPEKKSPKNGTRIPADWQPDVTYASSKGMTATEIDREAEKFRNFWSTKPGAGGLKLDWNRTWYTWVLTFCERGGRSPPSSVPSRNDPRGGGMSDDQWSRALELYERTGRWHRDYGPEPGRPGCRAPARLLIAPASQKQLAAPQRNLL